MKHIKLYEQFDFEDFSEEDLFGEAETRIMSFIKLGPFYPFYIVEKISHDEGRVYLYNNYNWASIEEYSNYKNNLVSIKDVPEDSLIHIYDEEGKINGTREDVDRGWVGVRKEYLPEEIKEKLK